MTSLQKCQTESWRRLHKFECKLLGRLATRGALPNAARLVLQMMYLAASTQENPFADLSSHLDEITEAGGERYENLRVLGTGVHQYAGKPLRIDTVYNFFAIVCLPDRQSQCTHS